MKEYRPFANPTNEVGAFFMLGLGRSERTPSNPTNEVGGWFISSLKPNQIAELVDGGPA